MWDKHNWEQFYDIAQRGWQRRPPPGPWPLLAKTVSCRWLASAYLNSTTPGLTRKSPNDSACPWTAPARSL